MSNNAADRKHSNIELIILGFLVSLTLKATFDAAYGEPLKTVSTWRDLGAAMWHVGTLQVAIFLITLIRFVYGAYRIHEFTTTPPKNLERWLLIWVIPCFLVLFGLFYVTGLVVAKPEPFYTGLIGIHVWDLVCFILPTAFSDKVVAPVKRAMRSFLVLDGATILVLAATIAVVDPSKLPWCGAISMTLFAAADFFYNWDFYFKPEKYQ